MGGLFVSPDPLKGSIHHTGLLKMFRFDAMILVLIPIAIGMEQFFHFIVMADLEPPSYTLLENSEWRFRDHGPG